MPDGRFSDPKCKNYPLIAFDQCVIDKLLSNPKNLSKNTHTKKTDFIANTYQQVVPRASPSQDCWQFSPCPRTFHSNCEGFPKRIKARVRSVTRMPAQLCLFGPCGQLHQPFYTIARFTGIRNNQKVLGCSMFFGKIPLLQNFIKPEGLAIRPFPRTSTPVEDSVQNVYIALARKEILHAFFCSVKR